MSTTRRGKNGLTKHGAAGDASSLAVARPGVADDVRFEILDAAAATFMQRGFSGTSIDDLADALGATKGRIYHYYRSKTDIFIDVHLEALRVLIERVGPIARRSDLEPGRRLRAMCREHIVTFITTVTYQKSTMLGVKQALLSITAPYQDDATKEIQRRRDEYERLYIYIIEEGVRRGEFYSIDPHFATKPLLGALNWANTWYESACEGEDHVDLIADTLADFCVKALLIRAPV